MTLFAALRQRLAWRLFLSYLVVVVVGVLVLASTVEFLVPAALDRHVAQMQVRLGDDPALAADLHANFHAAINEVLVVSALAAAAVALAVSLFTARRIVEPVQAMMRASQRLAAGDYRQRVEVPSRDELGALAEAFNRMAETLELTEQRRLELIGDVAHELRTPLSTMQGIMEGLEDGVLPAEPDTFLSVEHEIDRLQRLVHDLSELSRAEAGQIPFERRPTALADLVRTVTDRLKLQFDDKGVALRVSVAAGLPPVQADPNRITQVLLNLVGNALQYTPPGGEVTVRAWRDAREAVVAVQDTGVGIPPEDLPHVFERFYRVDKSRSRAGGGSGIGLTIAKHLVEAHGGRIWATSPGPGRGSTFTFTLPLAP